MLLRVPHRCSGLAAVLVTLLACALPACAPPASPDVLLIVVDTLRADRLGSYGSPYATKAMDALAAESLRFENAFANASRTVPSLASLFTSRLPSHHGLATLDASLSPELPTLAEAFQAGGYDTLLVSVSALLVDPATGLSRGFDAVEVQEPLPGSRTPADDPALLRDRAVTWQAIDWINQPRDAPYFLVVHYMGPHAPYDPRQRDWRGGTRSYRGPADGSLAQLARLARGELELEVLDRLHLAGLYDAQVQGVDNELGDLLGHLRRSGRLDDMLVALTSDHGEALHGDGAVGHGTTLYREQLHVPLLLHRPGGRGAGELVSRAVGLVDLGPTLLELAGLHDARESDGRSFVAALDAPSADADELEARVASELPADPAWASVWGEARHRAAVTTRRWTLLLGAEGGRLELYDVQADPQQENDRVAQEPEVVRSLARALPAAPAGE